MSSMEREDWEMFLESNYHLLSRRIRVENLLTRLRSDAVLNQDDQEMILNQYCTQFLKAGHLLDVVKTKGKTGFIKFMEAVEYEYPDVYQETTGVMPRPNPDKGPRPGRGANSILVLDKMGDLIHTFTQQLSRKQSELGQFQSLVEQLKADLVKQSDDQKIVEERIRHFEETTQEIRDEKKELMESLAKERRFREEIERKYDQLRNEKLNEFYKLSRQGVSKCISLDPFMKATTSLTLSSSTSASSPVERCKPSPANKGKVSPEDEKKTGSESDRSSADVKELRENCCQLQESNDRLQCCIEEFKKETEGSHLKQFEAEAATREAAADNEKLKMEMRKMEDQCKLMADMIRRLKNEIDSRPSKSGKKVLMPRMFPDSGSCDESKSSPDTSSTDVGSCFHQETVKPKLVRTKGDPKNETTFPAATNTILWSSADLFINPWKSADN